MIAVLEPLIRIPGVRMALLVGSDGVPVVARNKDARDQDSDGLNENTDALAGLASGWLGEVTRAIAPLSWNAPTRVVLWASRGTMIMCAAPGAVLLVVLDRGARPEDLRLPMGAAAARIHRVLRNMRSDSDNDSDSDSELRGQQAALADVDDDSNPPSALPVEGGLSLRMTDQSNIQKT